MKKALLLVLLITTFFSQAQDVACLDLLDYVKKNGYKKAEVSSYQLYDSSWLKKVTAYTIDNTILVVAEIKKDEYSIYTKEYIFCGIPSTSWDYFYYGLYDIGKSYGERFHKYIIKRQCNCY
ncbi:hypothetical protein [Leeuwenhoekiella marinoflava]|uniref:KTSC domain-containing protein n=2 Tax=Leeuwenhoekiella marinoflava TaxID=988 RepID=A0A4V1KSC6_9FLAO|nr:hypothetical protein [Leeuwenhoekiella marinoflava]RXG29880.1 hypothetical protein DSL99_1933 [Leeuwenhoekiella marinoflava]SHF27478.1 hypothetical protein SAMN02745246_02104 [Leeuwenhoekiella marinoflava DSM 3653]